MKRINADKRGMVRKLDAKRERESERERERFCRRYLYVVGLQKNWITNIGVCL